MWGGFAKSGIEAVNWQHYVQKKAAYKFLLTSKQKRKSAEYQHTICPVVWSLLAYNCADSGHQYPHLPWIFAPNAKLPKACPHMQNDPPRSMHASWNLQFINFIVKKIYLSGSPGAAVPQQFRFHPILHQNHLAEGLWAHIDSGGCRNQSRTWRPASIRSGTCHVAEMRCQFVGMRTWAAHQCQKSITKSD